MITCRGLCLREDGCTISYVGALSIDICGILMHEWIFLGGSGLYPSRTHGHWKESVMLNRNNIMILLTMACFALSGCGTASAGEVTPTLSSEDVLGTVQVYAEQTQQVTMQTVPPTPITPSPTVPQDTPTPIQTTTPSTPVVTADYNAFVREGPGESYRNIDFFLEGQTAEVAGQYMNEETGTWWYIRRIEGGKDGWVWSGAVTFAGNPSVVLHLEPPEKDDESD
jgi:hypothetical protein